MDEQKLTDRELLELAAKAAGYTLGHGDIDGSPYFCLGGRVWNPTNDDGDSRRLQVALSIDLRFGVSDLYGPYAHARTEVRRGDFIDFHECYQWVSLHPDANAAVRRAVLEVAAAVGQSMS